MLVAMLYFVSVEVDAAPGRGFAEKIRGRSKSLGFLVAAIQLRMDK